MSKIKYCVAPGCVNNSELKTETPIYFHSLDKIKEWHKFIGVKGKASRKKAMEKDESNVLCSAHFEEKAYADLSTWTLKKNPVATIHADFEENSKLCYICLSKLMPDNQYPITTLIQSKLEVCGLGFIILPKIPNFLCGFCNNEVERMVEYVEWIQNANNFWHKFGVIVKVINSVEDVLPKPDEEDYPVHSKPGEIWHCEPCNIYFSGKYARYRHEWKYHAMHKVDSSICTKCNKRFSSEYLARSHYFSKHFGERSKSTLCNDCGFLARNQIHLSWHRKNVHNALLADRIPCEWCQVSLINKEKFEEHMQYNHPAKWAESKAEKIKAEPKPVDQKPKETEVTSVSIKKEPVDPIDNSNDLVVQNGPQSKPKKKFRSQDYRRPNPNPDVTYTCPDCKAEITGKQNMARSGLFRHYWMRHGRLDSEPNKCKVCSKSFSAEHPCRLHFFDHHFENDYSCDLCGKKNCTKSEIKAHIKMAHMNKRETFTCRYCDKKFLELQKVSQHELEHQHRNHGTNHQCPYCFKYFPYSLKLKEHMHRHTGTRNFPCKYCDKKFFSRNNMLQHERTHTGPAYKCRICQAAFNQMGLVHKHAAKTHNVTDPEIVKNEMIDRIGVKRKGKRKIVEEEEASFQ